MQKLKYLTLHETQFELVDGVARASLENKADKSELENAGKVKTVNGQEPDAAGNIEIETFSHNLNSGYDDGNLTLDLKSDQFYVENVGGELVISPVAGSVIQVGGGFKPTPEQIENMNADHNQYITEHQDLSGYAKLEDIPESPDLSGYATVEDISGKADRSEIPDISGKANVSDVYNKTDIDNLFGNVDAILTQLGVEV